MRKWTMEELMAIPSDVLKAAFTGMKDRYVVYNFDFALCGEVISPELTKRLAGRNHVFFKFTGDLNNLVLGEETKCPW